MQRASALNAPMNDLIAVHVAGGLTEASGEVLWTQGDNVPIFHFQPRIMVATGHITVFAADKQRLFWERRRSTFSQFSKSSSIVFPTT